MSLFRKNPKYANKTATVPNGDTVSNAVDLEDGTFLGFTVPAALTGSSVSFSVSLDGVTYVTMKDGAGTTLTLSIGVDQYVPVDSGKFLGIRYIKLVCGSSQGAERVFQLATRNLYKP